MNHARSRTLRAALAAGLMLLLATPAAHAAEDQRAMIMDDDLLLYRGDNTRDETMKRMKALGADTVRVTVLWEVVAENARYSAAEIRKLRGRAKTRARAQNRRFRPGNPRTYPVHNWDKYDRLVRAARTIGLEVNFNITFPGPRWAHEKPPAANRRDARAWKPKPMEFYRFVHAVGKRYNGRYRDENDERQIIPKVSFWSIGNEPNQAGWLSPQWERTRTGSWVPAAPRLYRELYIRGRLALLRTGHRNSTILVGETAPIGMKRPPAARTALSPVRFVREMLCVDAAGREFRGASARARDCRLFRRLGPIRASGFAHHPYTKNVSPVTRPSDPEWITMANIADLTKLLDDLAGRTGNIEAAMPLYLTEFGFETNPPDPISGVSLERQAEWLMLGDLMAYANPRIKAQTQFLLEDAAPRRRNPVTGRRYTPGGKAYWFTYQSGLRFNDGRPKPAQHAWSFPFIAHTVAVDPATAERTVSVWGQAKFLGDGTQHQVHLQFRPADGSADWTDVGEPLRMNRKGFFSAAIKAPSAGRWRARVAFTPSPDMAAG